MEWTQGGPQNIPVTARRQRTRRTTARSQYPRQESAVSTREHCGHGSSEEIAVSTNKHGGAGRHTYCRHGSSEEIAVSTNGHGGTGCRTHCGHGSSDRIVVSTNGRNSAGCYTHIDRDGCWSILSSSGTDDTDLPRLLEPEIKGVKGSALEHAQGYRGPPGYGKCQGKFQVQGCGQRARSETNTSFGPHVHSKKMPIFQPTRKNSTQNTQMQESASDTRRRL